MLGVVTELVDGVGRKLLLGIDGKLWLPFNGVGAGLIPVAPSEFSRSWSRPGTITPPQKAQLACWYPAKLPRPGHWKWLWNQLENLYEGNELLVLWNYDHTTRRFTAIVPAQEVSPGSCHTNDAGAEEDLLVATGRGVIGTWHIHPGMSRQCSPADKREWHKWKVAPHAVANEEGISLYMGAGGSVWSLRTIEAREWQETVPVEGSLLWSGARPFLDLVVEEDQSYVREMPPDLPAPSLLPWNYREPRIRPEGDGFPDESQARERRLPAGWIPVDDLVFRAINGRMYAIQDDLEWSEEDAEVQEILQDIALDEENRKDKMLYDDRDD